MLNHLLYNKVSMIPNTMDSLDRPHLEKLFEEAVQKPLITVIAGAGYGKTQAVSTLLRDNETATIWLQLSALDNIVSRLWDRLTYAISLSNKKMAEKLALLGFPDSAQSFNSFLELLTLNFSSDKKFFFVLDDFHLISEKSIITFMDRLVHAQIVNLSLIIISRNELTINTVSLSSKGLLYKITEEDLRFKQDEVVRYLDTYGIRLPEDAVSEIHQYTDGWIFAIYLIRLSFKRKMDHERISFSAIKLDIFKLIENEVFSDLSKDLQDLLIKISFVENLRSELLYELASHNHQLIEELLKITSFIRYDPYFDSYRVHQIFSDYLHEKHTLLKKSEVNKLHTKAAKWYADNGYKIDAVIHYEKSNCYNEIIHIIMAYPSFSSNEEADFMIDLLNRFPKNLYEETPMIGIMHAKFLLNKLNIEGAYLELSNIRKKYEALPLTSENKSILGETYIILGLISFITSFSSREYEYKELFKLADECLPNGSSMIDGQLHLNRGTYACMVMHADKGEFERFQEAMSYAMPYASRVMNGCGYGLEYLTMAEASYFKRELKKAEKYAQQAIYKSQKKGQYDIENMAVFYLIRINSAYGHYTEVTALLDAIDQQAKTQDSIECHTTKDIIEGWFYALIGETQKIANWIKHDPKDCKEASPAVFSVHHFIRARYYLAEQRYYELIAFLQQRDMNKGLEDFLVGAIEIKVLTVIALYHTKDYETAMKVLEEAYSLAHANLIIMPFIEYGTHMRTIMSHAISDGNCNIPKEWMENILVKSSTYAKKLSKIIFEHKAASGFKEKRYEALSKRELEVLSDLCHGLTREEIADNLSLSVNTVKSMLEKIYTKLGAVNSSDAVRIAISTDIVK